MILTLEIISSVLIAAGIWLYVRHPAVAAVVCTVGNVGFIAWGLAVGAYGVVAMNVAIALMNLDNLRLARKKG